jgi:hypothetical protein
MCARGKQLGGTNPHANCVDLVTMIEKVTLKFSLRETNKVAHELTKFSLLNKESCNWVDESPSFILNNLIKMLL